MHRLKGVVFLLLLFIAKYQAQDPTPPTDWNGDPNLCTINPPPTPSSLPAPPMPRFPNKAEFGLERVEIKHIINITLPSEMTMLEYLYDYDANKLIIVKNKNGFIDAEYFYYGPNKKSTYYQGQYCVVTDIPTENDMDGASAIRLPNGAWHIRPLNEFLLFSSDDQSRRVTPVYLGTDTVRGIPVHKWQSCYVNKTDYRTVRRIWTFAQDGVAMPGVTDAKFAIPIQAMISGSYVFPNGTQIAEVDEIYNVLAFRPGIMETADALSPPKGVFCASGPGQTLISLKDAGVIWPNHFSVRVETSTSRAPRWERFHLRYDQGRESGSRRLRYDFMPPGAEDFQSVIHDYTNNLTYIMDLRVGSCKINSGVDIPDVSPIRDPIRFFVKHEARIIFNPPENAWEFNGFRLCRGNTIRCTILTTSVDRFPAMVEPDTGVTTGETWAATNVEYGWSMRSPMALAPPDRPKQFDYPVSLYLRMYRFRDPSNPSPLSIITEDVEYEFYEMSHDRDQFDFDISLCYRALNYEYLHLVFTCTIKEGLIDGNKISRRQLNMRTHMNLARIMQIKFSRISDVEIDHETADNSVQVFFTVLGRTLKPGTQSGFDDSEPTAATATDTLRQAIDSGNFQFDLILQDNSTAPVRAESGSLKSSTQYMSTHKVGKVVYTEKYTSGSQATAILVGLLIGIVLGVIIIAIVRVVRKEPMPALPVSISNMGFKSKTASTA
ncbi:unnamed protein product [Rotaria sordida]|uniref:Uncharacterized protein n=1 Tax=Rotaria sordida TaxID=392033 RepID=A0A813XF60_9BILA|nr:unnamed protein product [Rotaria sordida]